MTIQEYQKITKDLSETIEKGKGHVIFAIIVDEETNDMISVLDGDSRRMASAISQNYDKHENFRNAIHEGISISNTF